MVKPMADANDKPGSWLDQADNEVDRMLDAALAHYTAVEPRAGLEDRILANLRAQPHPVDHSWLRWGLAAAVAAIMVVSVALAWRSKPTPAIVVQEATATLQNPHESPPVAKVAHDASRQAPEPHRIAKRAAAPVLGAAVGPKLDVFPSPQPLSKQEEILASYVAHFGDEAVIVARVRAMALRDELEQDARETEAGKNHEVQAR